MAGSVVEKGDDELVGGVRGLVGVIGVVALIGVLGLFNIWWLVFVVGVLIAIFLHELGHYVTAMDGHEGDAVLHRVRGRDCGASARARPNTACGRSHSAPSCGSSA